MQTSWATAMRLGCGTNFYGDTQSAITSTAKGRLLAVAEGKKFSTKKYRSLLENSLGHKFVVCGPKKPWKK